MAQTAQPSTDVRDSACPKCGGMLFWRDARSGKLICNACNPPEPRSSEASREAERSSERLRRVADWIILYRVYHCPRCDLEMADAEVIHAYSAVMCGRCGTVLRELPGRYQARSSHERFLDLVRRIRSASIDYGDKPVRNEAIRAALP